jgi:hypothetical protein
MTLQQAVVPAGTLASNGQVTVPAQAVNAGPQGNIAANDMYGKCCRGNVFVSNDTFGGGQDARSYLMVTQQNINGALSSIKTSLGQSVQTTLSQQVQPSETCMGEVYDTNALNDLLMQTVTHQAAKRLGNGIKRIFAGESKHRGRCQNYRTVMYRVFHPAS